MTSRILAITVLTLFLSAGAYAQQEKKPSNLVVVSKDPLINFWPRSMAVGPEAKRVYIGGASRNRSGHNLAVLSVDAGEVVGPARFYPETGKDPQGNTIPPEALATGNEPLDLRMPTFVNEIVLHPEHKRLYLAWSRLTKTYLGSVAGFLTSYALDPDGSVDPASARSYSCGDFCTGLFALALDPNVAPTFLLAAGVTYEHGLEKNVIVKFLLNPQTGEPTGAQPDVWEFQPSGTITQLRWKDGKTLLVTNTQPVAPNIFEANIDIAGGKPAPNLNVITGTGIKASCSYATDAQGKGTVVLRPSPSWTSTRDYSGLAEAMLRYKHCIASNRRSQSARSCGDAERACHHRRMAPRGRRP